MVRKNATTPTQVGTICRQTIQKSEGLRRWDLVYQCLLRWEEEKIQFLESQEASYEKRNLCTSIDTASSADPND